VREDQIKMAKSTNTKVLAANEKKAATQALKDAATKKTADLAEDADWESGSNNRGAAKASSAADKVDEAVRKKREKEELLKAEEELMGAGGKLKTAGMATKLASRKKKKGGGSDLDFLTDSLVTGAEAKKKKKKEEAAKKKELEEQQKLEAAKKKEESAIDFGNGISNQVDQLNLEEGGNQNRELGIDEPASGIEGANSIFGFGQAEDKDQAPEKRMKAAHMAFEERVLPEFREQYPSLKLSQLKQKIFAEFQKSSENPKMKA